jgi:hypothetical protein
VSETLEELWISYNQIEKLKGIGVMKKLRVLTMSNNLVREWVEFMRLVEMPNLKELVFVGINADSMIIMNPKKLLIGDQCFRQSARGAMH